MSVVDRECEHLSHGQWRRWKVTGKALGCLYQLGVISGYGNTYSTHCCGCVSAISWKPSGRRQYVLGWPTDKWRCLLVAHHWPTEPVGLGLCAKCLPCEMCGSTEWPHEYLQCLEAQT